MAIRFVCVKLLLWSEHKFSFCCFWMQNARRILCVEMDVCLRMQAENRTLQSRMDYEFKIYVHSKTDTPNCTVQCVWCDSSEKNACSTWIAWIGACIYLLIHLFISYFVWAHGCVIIKFCLGSIKTDALSIRLVRISTRIQYTEIRKRAAQKLMHRIYQHGCGGLLHLISQFPHNAERKNSAI